MWLRQPLQTTRGDRSHIFRLQLCSWPQNFKPDLKNFQIWESDSCSDSNYHRYNWDSAIFLLLRNDIYENHADSCYCRKWQMNPVPVLKIFWLVIWIRFRFSKFFESRSTSEKKRRIPLDLTPAVRIRGHLCQQPQVAARCKPGHQRWALAWTRTMPNFVEYGLEPDCKLFHKFRIRTGLDCVNGKELRDICY